MSVKCQTISGIGMHYLRLQLTHNVGPIRVRNLLDHFRSVEQVLAASRSQLEQVDQISAKIAEEIMRARSDDSAEREVERAAARGARIICLADDDYPKPLLNIPDPPTCLYVRGELEKTDAVALAIVGTRRCSHYGVEQAVRFGELLGRAGFTVVSGLARGVDGHAHRGTLQAGGRTIAVLGNGLASIYPHEHESLAEEIVEKGAVVSEFPMELAPAPENFPRRNRIIAGLSLGVIVVEAGKRSGALITARLACEYNREVFAIPGRVDQATLTEGTNALIREGQAKLITRLDDVLDELAQVGDILRPNESSQTPQEGASDSTTPLEGLTLTPAERTILGSLSDGADDTDAICSSTRLEPACVSTALTSLQLKGLVRRLPGSRFACRSAK